MTQEAPIEMDIFSLAKRVFSEEVQYAGSMGLQMDADVNSIFEILSLFILDGIETLVNRGKIDVVSLQHEDKVRSYCNLLNDYMKSIDFQIKYTITEDDGNLDLRDTLCFENRKSYMFKVGA